VRQPRGIAQRAVDALAGLARDAAVAQRQAFVQRFVVVVGLVQDHRHLDAQALDRVGQRDRARQRLLQQQRARRKRCSAGVAWQRARTRPGLGVGKGLVAVQRRAVVAGWASTAAMACRRSRSASASAAELELEAQQAMWRIASARVAGKPSCGSAPGSPGCRRSARPTVWRSQTASVALQAGVARKGVASRPAATPSHQTGSRVAHHRVGHCLVELRRAELGRQAWQAERDAGGDRSRAGVQRQLQSAVPVSPSKAERAPGAGPGAAARSSAHASAPGDLSNHFGTISSAVAPAALRPLISACTCTKACGQCVTVAAPNRKGQAQLHRPLEKFDPPHADLYCTHRRASSTPRT
jgi:hypothetical protein